MVRMIRRDGGEMWVHESRVEEYLAAGCRQAPPVGKPPAKAARKTRQTAGK